MLFPAASVVPPAEVLVRLPTPKFPTPIEMLVAVNDEQLFLEWYLVERLMRAMGPAFPYIDCAKPLSQWAATLVPGARLRADSNKEELDPSTLAVRLRHSALPAGRHYFLVAGKPEYPLTFLYPGISGSDGTYSFQRYHIATLNTGSLFPPEIVRLVYGTLSYSALHGHVECLGDVEQALIRFGSKLRELFTARGMRW